MPGGPAAVRRAAGVASWIALLAQVAWGTPEKKDGRPGARRIGCRLRGARYRDAVLHPPKKSEVVVDPYRVLRDVLADVGRLLGADVVARRGTVREPREHGEQVGALREVVGGAR